MPEPPEVETVRRGLEPMLAGQASLPICRYLSRGGPRPILGGRCCAEFMEQPRTRMTPWYFLQPCNAPSRGEGRARPGGARQARAGCEGGSDSRMPKGGGDA